MILNNITKNYKYHKISILCTDQATQDLLPLIQTCKEAGQIGHTISITTDHDYDGEYTNKFYFDGDGSSKILKIKNRPLYIKSLKYKLRFKYCLLKWKIKNIIRKLKCKFLILK
jgi:hypothetical protein